MLSNTGNARAEAGQAEDPETHRRRMQRILDGLRGGEAAKRAAAHGLFAEFSGRLVRFFRRHGASEADAEDFAQSTLIRVFDSSDNFRGEAAQLAPFVWITARNLLLDAKRAGKRVMVGLDDVTEGELASATLSAPEQLERQSLIDCVRAAIRRFQKERPAYAQTVSWLTTDRLSSEEIASVLGRTGGATREHLSKCAQALRSYVEHCLT